MSKHDPPITDCTAEHLGHVTLDSHAPVVAGSFGQWRITYTVGSYGIDEGGTLKLAHRFASDWQKPQFDDSKASGYCTVTTTGEAKLRPHFEPKGHIRPYMKALVIDVYDGSLAPGDTVTITLGDRSGGGPGARAQTFQESAHVFQVFVDPTNACLARAVPDCPAVPIVAGEPVRLVCFVPTQCAVGEAVRVFVKGEDEWDNPTPPPNDVALQWQGDAEACLEGSTLTVTSAGTGRLVARSGELVAHSNPLTACSELPRLKRYWGDLHAQTDATVGTGTEEEYFTFARDRAWLDFASHQGNDFQMTDEDWLRLNDTTRRFHEDGRFVVFPGYEWSANTPAGGDRNVFYLQEGMPIFRSSHWQVPDVLATSLTPAHPAPELFKRLRTVGLERVIGASHVGGRYADTRRYMDDEVAPLVEVVSCWGVFEWMLWDASDHGYTVGVMCNSDGHKGRPGAEGPGAGEFGIAGGLTCVLAESLTREDVFAALRQRRCYGTTGARIDLHFEVDGASMGSCIEASGHVPITASVRGTAPLEALELYQGRQCIKRIQPAAFERGDRSRRIRVMWQGARIRGRGRRVDWDGAIRTEAVRITHAETVAFDCPAHGITEQDAHTVRFTSQTTGDCDGIDLWLEEAASGRIHFTSKVGELTVDLAELTAAPRVQAFGGLDMQVSIRRYPEQPDEHELRLKETVTPAPNATTPYFVKAIQV
ncbi:MAG: DUF3604 domain-containing protein, partial [Phycisphaeraceae bacterium]